MQGIVLKSIPYQDKHRIITLFTESHGLLSVLLQNFSKSRFGMQNVSSTLSHGEFHLKKGRGDLYLFRDATLLDAFLPIRQDLEKLLFAGKLLKIIHKTQYPEKPSPLLFALLKNYLNKIKTSPPSEILLVSFYVKILSHEGLLPERLEEISFPFNEKEWKLLKELQTAKTFTALATLDFDKELFDKTEQFFHQSMHIY